MAVDILTPKAHPEDVGTQILGPYIFNFDTANIGATTGVTFATLPAGSIVLRTTVVITTVFNAATTNVVTVGTGTTDATLMTSATAAAGTAGAKTQVGIVTGLSTPIASDVTVFAKYTQTGTAATTGRAVVYIEYYPARDYSA